jgi:hypothetical protein
LAVEAAELAFGVVITPTARPPMAPARIPIKARTIVFSMKYDLLRCGMVPPDCRGRPFPQGLKPISVSVRSGKAKGLSETVFDLQLVYIGSARKRIVG